MFADSSSTGYQTQVLEVFIHCSFIYFRCTKMLIFLSKRILGTCVVPPLGFHFRLILNRCRCEITFTYRNISIWFVFQKRGNHFLQLILFRNCWGWLSKLIIYRDLYIIRKASIYMDSGIRDLIMENFDVEMGHRKYTYMWNRFLVLHSSCTDLKSSVFRELLYESSQPYFQTEFMHVFQDTKFPRSVIRLLLVKKDCHVMYLLNNNKIPH